MGVCQSSTNKKEKNDPITKNPTKASNLSENEVCDLKRSKARTIEESKNPMSRNTTSKETTEKEQSQAPTVPIVPRPKLESIPRFSELNEKANTFSPVVLQHINEYIKGQSKNYQDRSIMGRDFSFYDTFKKIDTFINPVEGYMICKICNDVLFSPKYCELCNLFICVHCFERTKSFCKHISSNLNPYHEKIIEILKEERVKCYNSVFGCDFTDTYYNYSWKYDQEGKNHISTCPYIGDFCKNNGCDFVEKKGEVLTHTLYQCKYALFKCFHCEGTFIRQDKNKHSCMVEKNPELILPLRICTCTNVLSWESKSVVSSQQQRCNKDEQCTTKFFYKCHQCKQFKCNVHAPPPISKICGCWHKMKSGMLTNCYFCSEVGERVGWQCNFCGIGVQICENCMNSKREM